MVAKQLSQTVPLDSKIASSLNVVYFPQLGQFTKTLAPAETKWKLIVSCVCMAGYLICVPMPEEWQNAQAVEEIDGLTFQVGEL